MNAKINSQLMALLSATVDLRLSSHMIHLNTVGSTSYQNHLLTQRVYEHLDGAVDDIGEHIRTLGLFIPDSPKALISGSFLKPIGDYTDASNAMSALADSLAQIRDKWNQLSTDATNAEDQLTADFAAGEGREIAKLAYLVSSTVGKSSASVMYSDSAFKLVAEKKVK
jgi:DNA-binding ferritin-like protein